MYTRFKHKASKSQAWYHTPGYPPSTKELKASLGYTARLYLKHTHTHTHRVRNIF